MFLYVNSLYSFSLETRSTTITTPDNTTINTFILDVMSLWDNWQNHISACSQLDWMSDSAAACDLTCWWTMLSCLHPGLFYDALIMCRFLKSCCWLLQVLVSILYCALQPWDSNGRWRWCVWWMIHSTISLSAWVRPSSGELHICNSESGCNLNNMVVIVT